MSPILSLDFVDSFRTPYLNKILIGLMASTYGDALLNYEFLEFGMLMFGIAQAFYIAAFGWQPLKLWIGLLLYAVGGGGKSFFTLNLSCVRKMSKICIIIVTCFLCLFSCVPLV